MVFRKNTRNLGSYTSTIMYANFRASVQKYTKTEEGEPCIVGLGYTQGTSCYKCLTFDVKHNGYTNEIYKKHVHV